jgi:hypothetical protein
VCGNGIKLSGLLALLALTSLRRCEIQIGGDMGDNAMVSSTYGTNDVEVMMM